MILGSNADRETAAVGYCLGSFNYPSDPSQRETHNFGVNFQSHLGYLQAKAKAKILSIPPGATEKCSETDITSIWDTLAPASRRAGKV